MTIVEMVKKYLWIFIKYFSMLFFSFVSILPIVSCVITAFKTDVEYQNTNVMTPPEIYRILRKLSRGHTWQGRF